MRVVVMGVTGCGKSTVAAALAVSTGAHFADGDDFHSAANIAKMTAGEPLADEDRWPWLDAIGDWLEHTADAVVACSALKRAYRDRIRSHAPGTVFVHLAAPQSVLEARVRTRLQTQDHFAGPDLLASQYAALEPLGFDEAGATIDVANNGPMEVVALAGEFLQQMDT